MESRVDSLDMERAPELVIGYDENYFPTAATCSACGESMPNGGLALATSKETITRFESEFDLHIHRCHKWQDVN